MRKLKYNYGKFDGTLYTKEVKFSSAVLWITREISLRENIIARCAYKGVQTIRFVDKSKGEVWDFSAKKIFMEAKKKQVGQEVQYYFPIDWATRKQLDEVK